MASEINSTENRASAFQMRLPLPNCNALIKCEDSNSGLISPSMVNNSLRVPTTVNNNSSVNSCNNGNSNSNGNGNINHTNHNSSSANSNSPKMGSRRIFTPQFKLQVLESYRNDSDCKGNQRATARKYNIHRRQIQKWLQCESNLRSSVANINQNSVKHQFHNISHPHQHHQQQQHQHQQQQHSSAPLQSGQRLPMPLAVPSAGRSGANNGYGHHHHHLHNHPQVPLDAARQTLALNSLNVPSMPARVASSSATSAQGVLAANLAAAVAVAIASSSSPSTSTTAVSPLRPTAIGGAVGSTVGSSSVSAISPSMLHSHHHHHHNHHQYPLSPYARSPVAAPVPVSVPMLPHHIAPPHHQHYPYHNLSPHTHAHALPLSHQPSAFMPTACLPVNVLSAVAVASPPANATTKATDMQEKETEDNCTDTNAIVKAKLCEPSADTSTTETKSMIALPETMNATTPATETVLIGMNTSSYMHETEYENVYKGAMYVETERMRDADYKNVFQQPLYHYTEQDLSNMSMASPMDLSLGSRRKSASPEISSKSLQLSSIDDENTECHSQETGDNSYSHSHNHSNDNGTNTQVVDLTFRKRKVVTACSNSANDTEQPQKLAKRLEDSSTDSKATPVDECTTRNTSRNEGNDDNNTACAGNDDENDDDVEIEVEDDVDAKILSSKPVKLFKPYLLDDPDDCNPASKSTRSNSPTPLVMNEQREPIIWSNHPAFSYDSSRASSLHSPTADKHTFPNGSPYFLASKASSPQSVLSTTSTLSLSPTSFPLRCPKGSPVSGYESSSSTCSERDDTYSVTDNRSYSLNFQMHTVCENKVSTPPMQIRDWLNQDTTDDTNTPPLARASIALYA